MKGNGVRNGEWSVGGYIYFVYTTSGRDVGSGWAGASMILVG